MSDSSTAGESSRDSSPHRSKVYYLLDRKEMNRRTVSELMFLDFQRPVKMGEFVVKNKGYLPNQTVSDVNVKDFIYKYSLKKFNEKKKLDLKVDDEDRLENEDELLKLSGDLDNLLDQIVKNKRLYLNGTKRPADQNRNTAATGGQKASVSNEVVEDNSLESAMSKLNVTNGDSKHKPLYADFIGLRAAFCALLNCQYLNVDFTIYAEKFEGTIYLLLEKTNYSDSELLNHAYANKKLKTMCTEEFDGGEREMTEEETKKKYMKFFTTDLCFIFRAKMETHRLLYSASMNCFEENEGLLENPVPSSRIKSVELKSCRKAKNRKQEINFESYKTLRYWSHSYLVNNQKVAIAFMDDNYVVDQIQEYTPKDLIHKDNWSTKICFHQFNNILSFMKRCFKNEKNGNLLKFTHKVHSKKIVCEESTKRILSDSYKKNF